MPPLCESEATPLPPLPDEGLILEFENDPTPPHRGGRFRLE